MDKTNIDNPAVLQTVEDKYICPLCGENNCEVNIAISSSGAILILGAHATLNIQCTNQKCLYTWLKDTRMTLNWNVHENK